MDCPRCGGPAYVAEEEFVKIVENADPLRVIAKAIYECRSCTERFSRLTFENFEKVKGPVSARQPPQPPVIENSELDFLKVKPSEEFPDIASMLNTKPAQSTMPSPPRPQQKQAETRDKVELF